MRATRAKRYREKEGLRGKAKGGCLPSHLVICNPPTRDDLIRGYEYVIGTARRFHFGEAFGVRLGLPCFSLVARGDAHSLPPLAPHLQHRITSVRSPLRRVMRCEECSAIAPHTASRWRAYRADEPGEDTEQRLWSSTAPRARCASSVHPASMEKRDRRDSLAFLAFHCVTA